MALATNIAESFIDEDDWILPDAPVSESNLVKSGNPDAKDTPDLATLQIQTEEDTPDQEGSQLESDGFAPWKPDRTVLWRQTRRNILKLLFQHVLNKDMKKHQETLRRLAPFATNLASSRGKLETLATGALSLVQAQSEGLYGDEQEKLLGELICSAFFLRSKNKDTELLMKRQWEAVSAAQVAVRAGQSTQADLLQQAKYRDEIVTTNAVLWLAARLQQGIQYIKEEM